MAETSAKKRVALVGNPNAGKTSLFNALTGLHQKTGNYPGVTVEKSEGECQLTFQQVDVVDVPGLYSLTPVSTDEEVATSVLLDEGADLVVYVLDGSNIERNLFLFSQLADH
ncbi:MAG: FeoB small GTPase domain-containing protein, partial [Fimbriimonadaceae bacterium]